jgi:Do/DeqQ family serine protease
MTADVLHNRWFLVLGAALFMGALTGSWATVRAGWAPFVQPELVPLWMSSNASAAGADAGTDVSRDVSFANGFAPVVRKVLPAVVNITAAKIVRSLPLAPSPQHDDPFFSQFFSDERSPLFAPRERKEHSVGSGVVVSPDGYIITNDHVVNGSVDIKIAFPDKKEMTARLVGTDPKTDIAILKVEGHGLPAITMGDSSQVRVGDFTIAVGNSFGVGQAVTVGIISATGRGGFRGDGDEDFLQTDAAINPGNSGGALADINGNLIGISTAIISASSGSQGVGFAVPINMARHVMDEILKNGEVTRGWLGVAAQSLDTSMAKAFGLTGEPRGALINDVAPDSPAARAGLEKGDIILEIDGEPLTDSRAMGLKISATPPGGVLRLKVTRKGKEREVSVTLKAAPSKPAKPETPVATTHIDREPGLGLSVHPLTPQLARHLGLSGITSGIVIDDIQPGSPADDADLKRGDVIEEINQTAISKVDEFQNALTRAQNEPVLFLIARGRTRLFVVVEPGS